MNSSTPHLDPDHYLSTEEGARLTRKATAHAFRLWARRQGLRPRHAGRSLLYVRKEVELLIEGKRFPGDPCHVVTVARARRPLNGNDSVQSSEAGE
jgi:hypothetical protein